MKKPTRIAVLGYYHGPKLGLGVMMAHLVPALAEQGRGKYEIDLYTNANALAGMDGISGQVSVRTPMLLGLGALPAVFWSAILFPLLCWMRGYAAAILLTNPVVLLRLVPTISTIPDLNEFELKSKYGLLRDFYRRKIMLPSAVIRSSRLVTISVFVKGQVLKFFKTVPPERVSVATLGVHLNSALGGSEACVLSELSLEAERFYLVVGRLDPTGKNLHAVLDLYRALERSHPGHKLVLAGGINAFTRREAEQFLQSIAADPGLGRKVSYIGFVPDSDLVALYRHARATIFYSRLEGFGFPLIEAFKLGCPVIYNPDCEVLHDHAEGAGIPVRESEITDGLPASIRSIFDPNDRAVLKARMSAVAAKYDWATCAGEYVNVLDEVAG